MQTHASITRHRTDDEGFVCRSLTWLSGHLDRRRPRGVCEEPLIGALQDVPQGCHRKATGQSVTNSNNTGQYFGFRLLPDVEVLYLKGPCTWQPGQSRVPG